MLTLLWNLSPAIRGYFRFYMPTNRAVGWLRSPRAVRWAIPVALAATPAYLFAMSICAKIVERGGPGYLNVLVLLFAWNAIKFAALAVLTPFRWLALRVTQPAAAPSDVHPARGRPDPAGERGTVDDPELIERCPKQIPPTAWELDVPRRHRAACGRCPASVQGGISI